MLFQDKAHTSILNTDRRIVDSAFRIKTTHFLLLSSRDCVDDSGIFFRYTKSHFYILIFMRKIASCYLHKLDALLFVTVLQGLLLGAVSRKIRNVT